MDLPKSVDKLIPNEWRMITKDCQSVDEALTATYTRALQADCFDLYVPRPLPIRPTGFDSDYFIYQDIPDDEEHLGKKSSQWRKILNKYPGYFKMLSQINFMNLSDLYFLKDMMDHFKKIGLLSYAGKCRFRINEFREKGWEFPKDQEKNKNA